MPKTKTLSQQLRGIMLSGDVSMYRLAQEASVDKSQLSRFLNGDGRLTLGGDLDHSSLDRIGKVLELEIRIKE